MRKETVTGLAITIWIFGKCCSGDCTDAALTYGPVIQDPCLLWDSMADSIKDDWNNDNPGEAIGRSASPSANYLSASEGIDASARVAAVARTLHDTFRAPRIFRTGTALGRAPGIVVP